jgi:hypothetical protein
MQGLTAVARSGVVVLMLSTILVFAVFADSALGSEHVFDPTLSLTGSCKTSEIDPVPDPGCPEGTHPGGFATPKSVAVDSYGDIYVSNGSNAESGRIDIFNSSGTFISEVLDPAGPHSLAVDEEGNLYVVNAAKEIQRYSPTKYKPASSEIEYGAAPVVIAPKSLSIYVGISVDHANQHLFANYGDHIAEFASAAEENKALSSFGEGTLFYAHGQGLAVDSDHGRIYASDHRSSPDSYVVRVFELAPPHALLATVDGTEVPAGKFGGFLSVAVDESTGHFFVYDIEAKAVYEFAEDGTFVSVIEHGFEPLAGNEIAVDNGAKSPNGALNPDGRYLFVPSHPTGVGHAFAFGAEPEKCAPTLISPKVAGVTDNEAELEVEINPCNEPTEYVFDYTSRQSFEEEGFAGGAAVEGQLAPGEVFAPVSVVATGLSAGTEYVFRVTAINGKGSAETEGKFRTYLAVEGPEPCLNDPTRTGLSILLPDCRAYELVTPPNTNARTPEGVDHLGIYFATREASPAGDQVSFKTEGGSLGGSDATGSWAGDPYLASRGEEGWSTASAGPTGSEAVAPLPGSTSPDQGYSFWNSGVKGSASIEGKETSYVRYPDGHSELVGRGDSGTDLRAHGKLISENGGHIIFVSGSNLDQPVQLEPNAPPDGTRAIYDRTPDEVTHVVSLLPGDVTPGEGENASYVGASLDGKGVAFAIGKKLYLRFNNEETYEIGESVTFAGVAEGGARIFYLNGGDLLAFDANSEETIPFTESGDVTPVNVSADGSAAYFVSPTAIVTAPNPSGASPVAGKENLYLSRESAISFVATVTKRDVEGELGSNEEQLDGLGLWTSAVGPGSAELPGRFGVDSSRATPDGGALLFESRANLTGYDPEGHAEVYRFDSVDGELGCLSCNPTGEPATGEASLQSVSQGKGAPEPFSSFALVSNLRADGRRAFFQSTEPLVVGDTDGLQDVYEWEANGVGTCTRPEGCIYLISSGHSSRVDYLYAISESGDDVFFRSADLLLASDAEATPSIYDARVGGGFSEETVCQVECSKVLAPPPGLIAPASPPLGVSGNVKQASCPKGKHRVVKNGKTRCVKKHHKRKHHRAGSKKKGAGK